MASSEAMTSSTHSFAYSYRCFQKMFREILRVYFKVSQLPYFSTDFHQVLFTVFTLSSEIKLNLFRISPLKSSWCVNEGWY